MATRLAILTRGLFRNSGRPSPRYISTFVKNRKFTAFRRIAAFLTRIAKGLMIDAYRRQKIEEAYLESLSLMPETFIPGPEIHHVIIETLAEIAVMLDNLPDNVRLTLLLRQIEGLSYADIAKQLSVSVSSVEKYVARGLAACCLALESY